MSIKTNDEQIYAHHHHLRDLDLGLAAVVVLGLLPPRLESEVVGLRGPTSSTSMSSSSSEHSPSCWSQLLMLLSSSSDVKSLTVLIFFAPTLPWEPVPARASTLNRCKDDAVDPEVTPPILDRWWWWWSFLSEDDPCSSFWCCICWWSSLKRVQDKGKKEDKQKTRRNENKSSSCYFWYDRLFCWRRFLTTFTNRKYNNSLAVPATEFLSQKQRRPNHGIIIFQQEFIESWEGVLKKIACSFSIRTTSCILNDIYIHKFQL